MSDVASQPPAEGDDRRVLTEPAGPSGLRQPEPAHGRRARSGDARELPLPREDEPLRPRADPGARRARARHDRVRLLRGRRARSATSRSRSSRARSSSRRPASAPTSPCASRPWPAAATPPRRSRDPRGFAVKFYTEDGNWDLVGNNLGVFFIRDAIKFPDFIHSQKPDPVTFERQVAQPRLRLHLARRPSRCTWSRSCSARAASRRATARCRASASTPTSGSTRPARPMLVKYHWHPKQGVKSWTEADAGAVQGQELGVPHEGPLRRDRAPATTPSGSSTSR